MKKLSSIILVSLVLCIIFSMAISASEFPSAENANIDWGQAQGETIRVMACSRDAITYLKTLLPQFEELTGIRVVIDEFPEAEFFRRIIIDLSSGMPVSDVFMLSHAFSTMYAAGGWMEPLGPFLEDPSLTDTEWYDFDDFPKGSLSAVEIDGNLYGIPIAPDNQIMFYRTDLFEEAGLSLPANMDELYNAAVKLHNPPTHAGAVLRLARGAGTHWPWHGYIQNYGGSWLNVETKRPELDSPEVVAGTEMYIKLMQDAGPVGVVNYTWYEASSDFAQGKAAIFPGDANIFMSYFEDPARSEVAGNVGYALLPPDPDGDHAPAAGTAWHWGMSSKSESQTAGWLFIKWATSKDIALDLGVYTTEIIRNSVWYSETLKNAYSHVPDWIEASAENMARFSGVYRFPRIAEFGPLVDIVEVLLQKMYLGQISVVDGLAQAQAETLEIMGMQ